MSAEQAATGDAAGGAARAGKRFYRLGLTGYPLGHSRSPRLHAAALRAAGLDGTYELFPIPPDGDGAARLGKLLQELRDGRLDGLNVTIPHKQRVMDELDDLSPTARAAGAVNTLLLREGRLYGENTDVPGFLHDLERLWQLAPGEALVLGAGGSARAVVYGLASRGWRVRVLARRSEQARQIAADLCMESVETGVLTAENLRGAAADLVVNATPLGMHPHLDGCPWPEDLALPERAAVYDLVYNPQETRLVRMAKAQGLRAASGLGMLVAQAALAFALWTATPAPFAVMAEAAAAAVAPAVAAVAATASADSMEDRRREGGA